MYCNFLANQINAEIDEADVALPVMHTAGEQDYLL